ncbi:TPA: hypothetical protein HA361_04175 [Candidatus Woesearchaeota archaeon]|nr:hypothetical protein [Candidatus Woesearchaeota archaeon]HII69218.1 hypothetical protein [Candidatus Woesearchaeota archaeon]
MQTIKFLNAKEVKKIVQELVKQWGFCGSLDYAFLQTEKGNVHVISRDVGNLDLSKMRVNTIGLYFGEFLDDLRLSIEGSQIVGPHATKSVVSLTEPEMRKWMAGEELEKETSCEGFVIVRHGNDFLGCGKVASGGRILNYVPKARRVQSVY